MHGPVEEGVDLLDPRLDRDELRAPLDEEPGVESVALVHLECETAEVSKPLLADEEQCLALAPELAHGWHDVLGRRAVAVRRLFATARHPQSWRTTSRSSVISRTAYAGPSRVLPESLTPP